jgi:hypothetical protein
MALDYNYISYDFTQNQASIRSDQALTQDAVEKSANTVGWWGDAEVDGGPDAIFLASEDLDCVAGQIFHMDNVGVIIA